MKVFHSNCTLPIKPTDFVSSPNTRGTLDILWSCFSILVLSTWSILHLNVPVQSTPNGKIQEYSRKTIRFFRKLKWMAINVLAPEWVLGKAWSDYQSVSLLEKAYEDFKALDQVPWSRTHTYFANMGGFAIKFTPETRQVDEADGADEEHETDEAHASAKPDTPSLAVENATELPYKQEASHSRKGSATQDNTNVVGSGDATAEKSFIVATEPAVVTFSTSLGRVPQATSNQRSGSEQLGLWINNGSSITSKAEVPGAYAKVDEERGDAHRKRIRGYIRRRFEKGLRDFSDEAQKQATEKSSRHIGKIDWKLSDTNHRIISTAFETVSTRHFKSKWEKRQFDNYYERWIYNLCALRGDLWVLDANQLLIARELGIIDRLPSLSNDEIGDKNKGDALVKILALGQVIWFFIQIGARLGWGIPTSQLEIVVFSFAICIALTYGLLLDKPKDASTSVLVNAARYPSPKEASRIAIAGPFMMGGYRTTIWIPNNTVHQGPEAQMASQNCATGGAVALVIFGALHCVAWDFVFPSQIEQIFWRVGSLATIAALPLAVILQNALSFIWRTISGQNGRPGSLKVISSGINIALSVIFVVCRLFVIVEMFRSLANLPSGAFQTTWSGNLPHLG